MKKHSLISKMMMVVLCAVMLLTAMATTAFAAERGEDANKPFVIDKLPYSTTQKFYKVDTGETEEYTYVNTATGEEVTGTRPVYEYHYNYYYKYVADQPGRVTIKMTATSSYCQVAAKVNGTDAGGVYTNGTKSFSVDLREGDVLTLTFSVAEDTTASLDLSMTEFPMGSKYKPYQTDLDGLASGITVDLDHNECVYYTFTAPYDGVIQFTTGNVKEGASEGEHSLPTLQQIVFNEDTVSPFAYAMSSYKLVVWEGDVITIAMDCPGHAAEGGYTLYAKYVNPLELDDSTKAKLFSGMYLVEGTSSTDGTPYNMYGVRFNWSQKTVTAINLKSCTPLGVFRFTYNDRNGALVLTDESGKVAPYGLTVAEDYSSDLGACVKLVYHGTYLLNRCEVAPEPTDVVKNALTGRYEDIWKDKVWETLTFDYEAGTVVIAPDWNSTGVVYTMGNFDVFTGEMVIVSEKGDEITIGVRNGQVIYYNNPLTPVEAPHIHEYTTDVTMPTCTADGFTTYTCECGDTYTDDVVATTGHNYVDEVTAPTCTAGGYTTHTCQVCNEVITDTETEATGHSYGAWIADGESHKQTCATCNDVQTAQHTWDEGVTVKEPTELAEGELLLTCADCGTTKTQAIPTLGHEHKYEAVVTAPTCTTDGYTTHTCRCGDSYTEAGEKAKGHSYSDVVTAPTCTAGGFTTHTCATCGHSYQDSKTNATGHSYDGGQEANGQITYTCITCGDQYSVTISTNAFTVPGTLTGSINGSQDFAWVATESGYLIIDNISAMSGAYVSVTINGADAYPTENGYAVNEDDSVVITVTTYSQIDISIPVYMYAGQSEQMEAGAMAFEATFDGWNIYEQSWKAPFTGTATFVITESNVDAAALTFRVVGVDGQFYNQYEFGLDVNGNQFVMLEVTEGDVLTIVAYEDSMQLEGKLQITVQEGAPELHEHTYDEGVVTDPTCTTHGYTTYTCTVCGESYTDNKVEGSHAYQSVVTDPTCTEGGYTTYTCTVCGDSYVENGDKALYHSYGDWEVVKEATTTEPGSRKHTCVRCGEEETEEIPVIEQAPTTVPATQPAETAPTTQPATTGGNATEQNEGPSTVLIVLVVVAVVIAGGIVAVVVIKKKK